jgi:hypothetical protein
MNKNQKRRIASLKSKLCLLAILLTLLAFNLHACTIFVLTDTNRALFCNNEDWSDPNTRIWFIPAGDTYYGAVYVGFDNGWAQGGMNTEGLAYDWVAGPPEKYTPDAHLPFTRGNSSQRMLETCKTVQDAIAFYTKHQEPAFSYGKILIADKTGASAIIGAKDGKLHVEPEKQCRGFGFGHKTLDAALEKNPKPTVANAFKILHDCRQLGQYATKYCNIYDLKTGDIFLDPFPDLDDEVKLNLAAELKKGPHYYDMLQIQNELDQSPRPLPLNMKRFPLDEFKPVPDEDPEVTAHFRAMIQNATDGKMQTDDFTADEWKNLASMQKGIQAELKKFGNLKSMTLVERRVENGQRTYRYRIDFAKATILQHFALDAQNKSSSVQAEYVEYKPGANLTQTPADKISGIGVELKAQGTNLIINAIVPGSPAAAHKEIHVGDRILAIAQQNAPAIPVEPGNLAQTVASIRGPVGTTVHLTIASRGDANTNTRVVSIVRADLKTSPK